MIFERDVCVVIGFDWYEVVFRGWGGIKLEVFDIFSYWGVSLNFVGMMYWLFL